MTQRAFVSGCAGTRLTGDESDFFAERQPWGLILFKRNCESREQVAALVADFRNAVGRAEAPVLIDQEGGRVRRLRPPVWPAYPACGVIGTLGALDEERGVRAAWLHGRLLAADLAEIGITIDCLPVLDVLAPDASEAIGDRAFGSDPALVAVLGRAMADGLLAGGVCPVVKHMPGQGRATSDSHHHLPVVDADIETLAATDFAPFVALADLPCAITSHTVFSAIDPNDPATTSRTVIRDIIRERIGFDGLLMSDDISMNALSGDCGTRASTIHGAGCDIVLHCNGDFDEMSAVADAVPLMDAASAARAERVITAIRPPSSFDRQAGREEYLALTAAAGWTPGPDG
jgi:beta-N-acetylhexosaminidase